MGFLDLADDELEHILRFKQRQKGFNSKSGDISGNIGLICELSAEVVKDIVGSVAKEMMDEDVIRKLLQWELKESKV